MNCRSSIFGFVFAIVASQQSAEAMTITWTTIDYPNVLNTQLTAVSGDRVMGLWFTENYGEYGHFIFENGVFSPLDFAHPEGSKRGSTAWRFEGDEIVGNWLGDGPDATLRGLWLREGEYESVVPPDSDETYLVDVLDGKVLGNSYDFAEQVSTAFIFDGQQYTMLRHSDSRFTVVEGFSGNRIVGSYRSDGSLFRGFVYENGEFSSLDLPIADRVRPLAVDGNNIVGEFVDTDGLLASFLFDGTNTTELRNEDWMGMRAVDIEGNTIVGTYFDGPVVHGFIATISFDDVAGDVNGDGKVDLNDFGILKANFGKGATRAEGDLNSDGKVDLSDFGMLKAHFGTAATVPEPSTVALLALGTLLLFARRGPGAPVRLVPA
jgi:hypothetical protein